MAGDKAAALFKNVASILDQLQGTQTGGLQRIWATIQPWMARLVANAPAKWLPILTRESPCFIQSPDGAGGWIPCNQPAISLCDCCGKPVCLHHCRIDSNCGCICFPCVSVAYSVVRGKPPEPAKPKTMDRAEALQILGLSEGASKQEIASAFKKAAKKYHPDTKDTGDSGMFIRVQQAKAVLMAEK